MKPLRPCRARGCVALAPAAYCPRHAAEREAAYEAGRGSAASRGYDRRWRRLAKRFLAEHPICNVEGCNKAATDVDHVVPKRAGGSDADENLQALCHECHSAKTAREVGRWG